MVIYLFLLTSNSRLLMTTYGLFVSLPFLSDHLSRLLRCGQAVMAVTPALFADLTGSHSEC